MHGWPRGPEPFNWQPLHVRFAIGPVEIAGIAESLAHGLRANGHEVTVALRESHKFGYQTSAPDRLTRAMQRAQAHWTANRSSRLRWLPAAVAARTTSWLVLLKLARTHDTFVFMFSRTFTNSKLELRLLRLLRRKIVFLYCGSDLRPAFMDGPSLYRLATAPDAVGALASTVKRQRELVAFQERHATLCLAHPSCAHFLTRPFVSLAKLGIPSLVRSDEQAPTVPMSASDGVVRALHAPSDVRVKGTERVLRAVAALRDRGVPLELTVVTGEPHERVLEALRGCDFVIDQVYADLPLGTLGVEAARLGKPTVLAGYFAERIDDFLPRGAIPPSLFVLPHDLEGAIEALAIDTEQRRRLGSAAKEFSEVYWSPSVIAEHLVSLLSGRATPDLLCDPFLVDYVLGCGISRDELLDHVEALVNHFGEGALMLHDKPRALAALLTMLGR